MAKRPPVPDFNAANALYEQSHLQGHAPSQNEPGATRPGWSNNARIGAAEARGAVNLPYGGQTTPPLSTTKPTPTPPAPAPAKSPMAWDRVDAEQRRNSYLNDKFFQPPFVREGAPAEEAGRVHDWIRDWQDVNREPNESDQSINKRTLDESWRLKKPSLNDPRD